MQVQRLVSVQSCPAPSRQMSPLQQFTADEHGCPAEAQVAARQVPMDADPWNTQARPVQQSADAVHTLDWGWQLGGALHTP